MSMWWKKYNKSEMLILKTFCQEKSQNENVRFRKKDEWILNNHVKKEVFWHENDVAVLWLFNTELAKVELLTHENSIASGSVLNFHLLTIEYLRKCILVFVAKNSPKTPFPSWLLNVYVYQSSPLIKNALDCLIRYRLRKQRKISHKSVQNFVLKCLLFWLINVGSAKNVSFVFRDFG